ncbi:MAG: hypothetical protein ACJ8H8_27235, partial [Geminicoccaceae bacterium]
MLLTSLLAAPFTTLLPVFARDILAAGPSGQGMLLSAMGIGALGSAIVIATLGGCWQSFSKAWPCTLSAAWRLERWPPCGVRHGRLA